jgi:hypothetical protein
MTGRFDWLDGLDDEDLRCAGLHRDNEWKAFEREIAAEKAIAGAQTGPTPPAPKPPRIRRPSLESQVRQLLKAAQVAGVQIAVTIEGDKVTATPVRGSSPATAKIQPMARRRRTPRLAAPCSRRVRSRR